MKIYTKTGDDGTSGLFGGQRVKKTDKRLEAYGTVDELNSFLGLTVCHIQSAEIKNTLQRIQNIMFNIGAKLATPNEHTSKLKDLEQITEDDVKYLENRIDEFEVKLKPINNFIIPGGTVGAGYLHVARSICRRCERRIIAIDLKENINEIFIRYFNRLSDYLFVAARYENMISRVEDVIWNK
jgi:cob(I)alamin adenosyltransferase